MARNLWDKVVGFFSPELEARRIKGRIVAQALRKIEARSYDGASKGRRLQNWNPAGTSADAASSMGLATLRNRSRDLVRNNPYAERAIRAIMANTIGTGIVPQAKGKTDKVADAFEALWRAWGESTACDVDGRNDFYGIQAVVMRTVAESGECLIRRIRRRSTDGLPLPIQLQVLEPDYLDTSKDGDFNGKRVIQGVEFDARNNIVAYWLFPEHPGNTLVYSKRFESQRIDASEVIRVYRQDRPGQVRGVPWLAPTIVRLDDLDGFEHAQLMRQKVAACHALVVRQPEPLGDITEGSDEDDELGRVEPGMIMRLKPGEDVSVVNPPGVDGYSEHTRSVLRSIAVGLGVSFEVLTGDLSQVNFSSARMGWLEFQRNIDTWRSQMLIPMLCNGVWAWFVEAAELANAARGPVRATWTPPRREMIDPKTETDALKAQVRNGFMSLSEALLAQGRDPLETFNQIAADYAELDKRGIILDVDSRRRSLGGQEANPNAAQLTDAG
jgi:lambda family phage portal protein